MNEIRQFTARIRALVAKSDLKEALSQLRALLENSPALDEAVLQSARLQDIHRQIRLGVVDNEHADLTQNKIGMGILDLLRELESPQGFQAPVRTEAERAASVVNSKNVVIGSTIQAGGDVHIGDKHIEQKAEKIYNIDKIDNANFS